MSMFAHVGFAPGGPALWVIVGLLVGVFAGLVLRGNTGVVQDVAAGVAGAAIGGALAALLAPDFWGSLMGAFGGACGVIATM